MKGACTLNRKVAYGQVGNGAALEGRNPPFLLGKENCHMKVSAEQHRQGRERLAGWIRNPTPCEGMSQAEGSSERTCLRGVIPRTTWPLGENLSEERCWSQDD